MYKCNTSITYPKPMGGCIFKHRTPNTPPMAFRNIGTANGFHDKHCICVSACVCVCVCVRRERQCYIASSSDM